MTPKQLLVIDLCHRIEAENDPLIFSQLAGELYGMLLESPEERFRIQPVSATVH